VFGAAEGGEDTDGGGDYDQYKPAPKAVPRQKPPLFDSFEEENALSGLSEPFQLPEGVKIVYVRTADDLEAITEGEASIYFFPHGRTQQAHILIEDTESDAKWTIKVAPLTGRVKLEEGHEELELPDERDDAEDDLGKKTERRTL
jgi:general secretion pathway protein H